MSLVVVVNGQYKNYELSDINPQYRVRHSAQSAPVHAKDSAVHDEELSDFGHTRDHFVKKQKLSQFEKIAHPKERRHVKLARDIMSKPLHYVFEDDPLIKVREEFSKFHFRHMPVFQNNQMTGMVSERDMVKASCRDDLESLLVKDVMSTEALLAKENSEIPFLAKVMLEERINSLPIIDDDHNVVGIVTISDILKVVVASFPLDTYTF